jgi:hypothetical protein
MTIVALVLGLTNLILPKQVMTMCEWFGTVVPWASNGLFAEEGASLYRFLGAVVVTISVIALVIQLS